MAIKAGQALFLGDTFVISRIQTGGVTQVAQPSTQVHELGDFQVVGVVRDSADLSFEIQSVDTSTDLEALTLGLVPSTVTSGQVLDFGNSMPMSIASPFRTDNNVYTSIQGIAIPHVTLETVTYRYGLRANAEKTFTYRGDSIYYIPGSPYVDKQAGGSTSYTFTHGPAIVYHEEGNAIYALNVTWVDTTTNTSKRLFRGIDFTDSTTGINLNAGVTIPGTASVYITYGSAVTATYPSSSTAAVSTTHPAAVRSKDIDVYVGGAVSGATPAQTLLRGVQAVDITRRVNLQNDEEFGNSHYVSQDYDTADVSGTVQIRAASPSALISTIQTLMGVNTAEIAGPFTSPPIELEIVINDPVSGAAVETIYVPDAEFTAPPISARVQSKVDFTASWSSASGALSVIKGLRTWS